MIQVAALYVETAGCYFGLPDVDPWDEPRDARNYRGPHPVVAHPPCQRWGRYATGSPRKPSRYRVGEDGGCFGAALAAVRNYGGVLEHPKDSLAWDYFGIMPPPGGGRWLRADNFGGWTCCVEQGHYGHFARKATWLYAVCPDPPSLVWGPSEQRLPAYAVERYGYEKARRIGVMAAVGGKNKTIIRNATPVPFRDVLLGIARSAKTHITGTVPMKEQAKADDAGEVMNSSEETPSRQGSHLCAPNLPLAQSA